MTIESDDGFKPPIDKIHEGGAVGITADLNAFSAKDTPVGIVAQERMIIHCFLIFQEMFQAFRFESHFQKAGDFLQFAFLVGRTMAAVHMVYREQQLKGCPLQPPHRRCVGHYHHIFGHFHLA